MTSTQFADEGDRHFDRLVAKFPGATRERLAFGVKLDPDRFAQVRTSMMLYLSASLGLKRPLLVDSELRAALLEQRGKIPNQGPTGQVVPKRDHIIEFNRLHRSVAACFADLGLEDIIDTIDLPFSVRMVYGAVDPSKPMRPYASPKPHTDVWAGIPPDAMVVVMPVLFDIEHITIEFGELPRDQELEWMKKLPDFLDGKHAPVNVPFHDVAMKLGHLYVGDARGLHKTVRRKAEGVRVSIDFRFRLKDNAAYRQMATHGGAVSWSLEREAPYQRWLDTGTSSLMVFEETQAEAAANGKTMREGPDYGTDYKPVQLY